MNEDYSLYSYYRGGKESPFDREKERAKGLFWYIESMYYNNSLRDVEFQQRIINWLEDYINSNNKEENVYTDYNISIEKRALIFYVDLMIGKWCPYESDLILEYDAYRRV